MNMLETIIPKSDQLNADDLIGGPITIQITQVSGSDTPNQPVKVNFDGDGGKPYKPCKSMRRVMIHAWGPDAVDYAGRFMTLFCDPGVQFGGMKVGGIRISAMSHIDRPLVLALTAAKDKRLPYTVQPLQVAPTQDNAALAAERLIARIQAAGSPADLLAITDDPKVRDTRARLAEKRPELAARVDETLKKRHGDFMTAQDDGALGASPAADHIIGLIEACEDAAAIDALMHNEAIKSALGKMSEADRAAVDVAEKAARLGFAAST